MTEQILCDCRCNFNSAIFNSSQKWNNKTCQCKCKYYCKCKKNRWNPNTCVCENSKYLKSIPDISVDWVWLNCNYYGYCPNKKIQIL